MSTHSRIGIKNEDGSVESIYCHFDGGLDYNGMVLSRSYVDEAKVRELIALGDISSLGSHIGEKHPSLTHMILKQQHKKGKKKMPNFQKYKDKYGDWVLAYGRDCGEEGTEAKRDPSEAAYRRRDESYLYLFKDSKWFCKSIGGKKFVEIKAPICGSCGLLGML